ncbi:MAG: BMC domain protein [Actinobacteria bacterium ADurb.Bin346]|nr:MAG: BMC domain protein [Actinobacteria bacterium ADurb.Bin346]
MKIETDIAAVEFKSIAKGMIVTDEMLKAAQINLVLATTLCPGKYLTIVSGKTSAVEKSVEVADRLGGREVFSSFVISAINSEIIDAISGKPGAELEDSIGIIESLQMANLINAADISLDSAEVKIVEFRLGKGCGVNSFYIITGKLTAVEEAVKNSAEFLKDNGSLIAFRVIASPDRELLRWLEPTMCMC